VAVWALSTWAIRSRGRGNSKGQGSKGKGKGARGAWWPRAAPVELEVQQVVDV